MDFLIYALAILPGLFLCFVDDVGPIGGITLMGVCLLVAPYVATAVVVFAICFAIWFVARWTYCALTGGVLS